MTRWPNDFITAGDLAGTFVIYRSKVRRPQRSLAAFARPEKTGNGDGSKQGKNCDGNHGLDQREGKPGELFWVEPHDDPGQHVRFQTCGKGWETRGPDLLSGLNESDCA